MTRIAVFAYASLVHRGSAALTLGREVEPQPARLPGWRRRWSVARDNLRSEKTFALAAGGERPRWVLGLNLEPAPDGEAALNGALIEVSASELAALDRRELRYRRVDVAEQVGDERFDTVFAYVARPAHFAPRPPAGAVIIAGYLEAVRQGFAALGEGELDRFLATTAEPPVPPVEAVLLDGAIPPGNPREW